MTPQQEETRLTFGIEIEFAVGYVRDDRSDFHPQDPRAVKGTALTWPLNRALEAIGHTIERAGCPAGTSAADPTALYFLEKWMVSTDSSVSMDANVSGVGAFYQSRPIEISSPPYYYDASSSSAVQQVASQLAHTYRINCGRSAGVHVHVGHGWSGFPVPVLRKLMAFLFTYENQLAQIHPRSRTSGNTFCQSFGYAPLRMHYRNSPKARVLKTLRALEDVNDIVHAMNGNERLAYNILGLRTPSRGGKRTIEFRQHRSTLDPKALANWIHLCVKIVEFAFHADEDKLFEKLERDIGRERGFGPGKVSTVEVLMYIGCPVQAAYYGARLHEVDDDGNYGTVTANDNTRDFVPVSQRGARPSRAF